MNNIKLFTHTDLDGVGCYIVLTMAGYDVDVIYCSYNDIDEKVLKTLEDYDGSTPIFITDISVSRDVAEKLDLISDNVTLIDHHATAKWLNEYEWATVHVEGLTGKNSGTNMLYDIYNYKTNCPGLGHFVEKVRRYDTWEWKTIYDDKEALYLNDLFYLLEKERFASDMIEKLTKAEYIFSNSDLMLLEVNRNTKRKYIEKKMENLIFTVAGAYNIGLVIADSNISELGNSICERYKNVDIAVMISHDSISLRTVKDDIDVGEIAKRFNGGGHRAAAGMPLNKKNVSNLFFNSISMLEYQL